MQKNYRAKCRLHMFSCANTDESTREQQHPQMFVGKSLNAQKGHYIRFLGGSSQGTKRALSRAFRLLIACLVHDNSNISKCLCERALNAKI